MRVAVIDLGTNTFNLLIADLDVEKRQFGKIYNEKIASKIGRGGINDKLLTDDAIRRGIDALKEQKKIIERHKVSEVYAIGTSALRNASNRQVFLSLVYSTTGITVDVIDGNQEAELIYKGNKLAVGIEDNVLILDIGGGSNEFIIANKTGILWKQSFEIGMQRLLHLFNPDAPMKPKTIDEIYDYVNKKLEPLFEAVKKHPVATLIGSSGSFDTFRNILCENGDVKCIANLPSCEIPLDAFCRMNTMLLENNHEQLALVKVMDESRLEFLPTSSVFVKFVLTKLKVKKIIQSSYSLKEGVLASIIERG